MQAGRTNTLFHVSRGEGRLGPQPRGASYYPRPVDVVPCIDRNLGAHVGAGQGRMVKAELDFLAHARGSASNAELPERSAVSASVGRGRNVDSLPTPSPSKASQCSPACSAVLASSCRTSLNTGQQGNLIAVPLMKLATWNLELPVAPRRRQAMRSHTDREQADVWVLTETHDSFTPGHAFSHSSTAGRDGRTAGAPWVTIWSRYPLEPLETSDGVRTAAARVRPESAIPSSCTAQSSHGSAARGEGTRTQGVAFPRRSRSRPRTGCESDRLPGRRILCPRRSQPGHGEPSLLRFSRESRRTREGARGCGVDRPDGREGDPFDANRRHALALTTSVPGVTRNGARNLLSGGRTRRRRQGGSPITSGCRCPSCVDKVANSNLKLPVRATRRCVADWALGLLRLSVEEGANFGIAICDLEILGYRCANHPGYRVFGVAPCRSFGLGLIRTPKYHRFDNFPPCPRHHCNLVTWIVRVGRATTIKPELAHRVAPLVMGFGAIAYDRPVGTRVWLRRARTSGVELVLACTADR